ncbi:ABC transporter ATP-binding protein [Patescibacteria group bacterium]|nr:MAG: ABC transporter ATP-binding protein [Patescibacteria group bacterium]
MRILKLDFSSVIKYLKPYRTALLGAAVFVILENAIQLILPIFYGKALDIVVHEKTFSVTLLGLIASWFVLSILGNWFMRMRIKRGTLIGYRARVDLFTKSIFHLLRLPLAFHKQRKIGEVIEQFDRAHFYLESITNEGLLQIGPHLITSLLAFLVIVWIKWELALIYALFVVAFLFITIKRIDPIVALSRKINKLDNGVYGDIFDRTPNVVTIKSNIAEAKEYNRNRRDYERIYGEVNDYTDLWMNLQIWQDMVFVTGFLILFTAGLYFIKINLVTVGEFVMLLAYVNAASASIQRLGVHYKELQEGIMVINGAEKIYQETIEQVDKPGLLSMPDCRGKVEFKNVSVSMNGHRILKDITFSVKPGQLIAIVGRSGQGKSTLVDLIPRFLTPSEGRIMIDGTDIRKIKLSDLRSHIGVVSQESGLFNDTIKHNIHYAKNSARLGELYAAANVAHCPEFIRGLPHGYDTIVGDRGTHLSTGQRQRIAIARAVLKNPNIIILDEATSALDSESEKYIHEAMEQIMQGRTTFVIAHRLSTVRQADLILVLEGGEIVERGDHHELMRHGGVYKKLHELQHVRV